MSTRYRERERSLRNERGFTLPEVLTTVAILGILIAIAMALWNSVTEARRVDAAANQFASDMRLAHTKATNQLVEWEVFYKRNSPDYQLREVDGSKTISRSLPEGTKVLSASNMTASDDEVEIKFKANGTGTAFHGCSTTVVISAEDGKPRREIGFRCATSQVYFAS